MEKKNKNITDIINMSMSPEERLENLKKTEFYKKHILSIKELSEKIKEKNFLNESFIDHKISTQTTFDFEHFMLLHTRYLCRKDFTDKQLQLYIEVTLEAIKRYNNFDYEDRLSYLKEFRRNEIIEYASRDSANEDLLIEKVIELFFYTKLWYYRNIDTKLNVKIAGIDEITLLKIAKECEKDLPGLEKQISQIIQVEKVNAYFNFLQKDMVPLIFETIDTIFEPYATQNSEIDRLGALAMFDIIGTGPKWLSLQDRFVEGIYKVKKKKCMALVFFVEKELYNRFGIYSRYGYNWKYLPFHEMGFEEPSEVFFNLKTNNLLWSLEVTLDFIRQVNESSFLTRESKIKLINFAYQNYLADQFFLNYFNASNLEWTEKLNLHGDFDYYNKLLTYNFNFNEFNEFFNNIINSSYSNIDNFQLIFSNHFPIFLLIGLLLLITMINAVVVAVYSDVYDKSKKKNQNFIEQIKKKIKY